MAVEELIARTDRQGRWHIDLIPAGFDLGRLHFVFEHPDFLSSIDASNNQPTATPGELRSESGVSVLRPGIAVSGRVLDREGHLIAGASVRLNERARAVDVVTDSAGRFLFKNAAAGASFVTAQAAGRAPEMQPVMVGPGLPPVELRLGPGNTVRGRVVDSRGQPIAGAIAAASEWRELQALTWRSETDADGRFLWNDAPADAVLVSASKPGYSATYTTMKPSENEHVVKLARQLLIRGTVTDAETGRPVGTFTVVPGMGIGGDQTNWMPGFARTHHRGRYEFPFDGLGVQPLRARIEAEGYRAAISPFYEINAGEQVFDARLERGEWVKGVVHGLGGAPLSGAEVIIPAFSGIHIGGGMTYQRDFHRHMVTGADGGFAFPPSRDPFRVVVLHDQGYAEATCRRAGDLHDVTVLPWGRIEGTLRVGAKLLAHETIVASIDEERTDPRGSIQNESRAQTDLQGRFSIERVAPGEARVGWQPRYGGARQTPDRYYQAVIRTVGPGQAIRVDLVQEGGRPLVGRVVAGDHAEERLDLAGAAPSWLRACRGFPTRRACPRRNGGSGWATGGSPKRAARTGALVEALDTRWRCGRTDRFESTRFGPVRIKCTFRSKALTSSFANSKCLKRPQAVAINRLTLAR